MRFATFSLPVDPTLRLGIVDGDRITDVSAAFPGGMIDLVQTMGSRQFAAAGRGPSYGARDVKWHAPIPRPRKNIVCLGLNYMAHMKESSAARGREAKIPEVPVFFTKAPTAVNGPYDPIPWDQSVTQQVDYEAELGVIIGA